MDKNPSGADGLRLKMYWTVGEGRAKWSTWTELFEHLRKHITPEEKAKAVAAAWYHLATGIWPGSDANRVAHGKPPRGKVIGKG